MGEWCASAQEGTGTLGRYYVIASDSNIGRFKTLR